MLDFDSASNVRHSSSDEMSCTFILFSTEISFFSQGLEDQLCIIVSSLSHMYVFDLRLIMRLIFLNDTCEATLLTNVSFQLFHVMPLKI